MRLLGHVSNAIVLFTYVYLGMRKRRRTERTARCTALPWLWPSWDVFRCDERCAYIVQRKHGCLLVVLVILTVPNPGAVWLTSAAARTSYPRPPRPRLGMTSPLTSRSFCLCALGSSMFSRLQASLQAYLSVQHRGEEHVSANPTCCTSSVIFLHVC